eukprot:756179-Hanusia_phi.AAC.4
MGIGRQRLGVEGGKGRRMESALLQGQANLPSIRSPTASSWRMALRSRSSHRSAGVQLGGSTQVAPAGAAAGRQRTQATEDVIRREEEEREEQMRKVKEEETCQLRLMLETLQAAQATEVRTGGSREGEADLVGAGWGIHERRGDSEPGEEEAGEETDELASI